MNFKKPTGTGYSEPEVRIRLFFIVSTLRRCGPTNQLYNLITNLDVSCFDITLVTLSPESNDSRWFDFLALDCDLCSLSFPRLTSPKRIKNSLAVILKSKNPHIVHTQGLRADYIASILEAPPNRVTTQRNYPYDDFPLLYIPVLGSQLAKLYMRALKRIPYIIACSNSIEQALRPHLNDLLVIPNGVAVNSSSGIRAEDAKRAARAILGIPVEGPVFLFTGPLISRKQPELLLEHFNICFSKSTATLCVVGDGPLLARCRMIGQNSPNILLPGHVEDLTPYLTAADVYVSASSAEGLPNSVLEALSFGLPTILSDIPAHAEINAFAPSSGSLVKLTKELNLFSVFDKSFLTDTRRWAALSIAKHALNAEQMAIKYSSFYKSIVKTADTDLFGNSSI